MSVELSRLDALRFSPPNASVLIGFLALEAVSYLEAKLSHVYLGKEHYLNIINKRPPDGCIFNP